MRVLCVDASDRPTTHEDAPVDPEEYKITINVLKNGTEYREDHILPLIGLYKNDIIREKDNALSMTIKSLIENIERYELQAKTKIN